MNELCHCGVLAVERTAWTDVNAGRRLCGYFRAAAGYGYFRWVNPLMTYRALTVINGLLRRVRDMEERHSEAVERLMAAHEREVMKVKKGPTISWFTVIVFVVFMVVFCLSVGNEGDEKVPI